MDKLTLISTFLFTISLASCSLGPARGKNETESGSVKADAATEEASQRKNILFQEKNLIGKKNFPLTILGQKTLPNFLKEIQLNSILNLGEINGTKRLTGNLCKDIIHKFKGENPSTNIQGNQCNVNLNDDGTYSDVEPLTFSLSEFEGKYLLLLIDEAGLGAPKLFTYVYDLNRHLALNFNRPSLGETIVYYNNDILYFVNVSGYLQFSYDLKNMRSIEIQAASS